MTKKHYNFFIIDINGKKIPINISSESLNNILKPNPQPTPTCFYDCSYHWPAPSPAPAPAPAPVPSFIPDCDCDCDCDTSIPDPCNCPCLFYSSSEKKCSEDCFNPKSFDGSFDGCACGCSKACHRLSEDDLYEVLTGEKDLTDFDKKDK